MKENPTPNYIGKEINNYIIKKYLGSGSFGHVFMASHKKKNQDFAIKIPIKTEQKNGERSLLEEAKVYKNLNCASDFDKYGISEVKIIKDKIEDQKVIIMNLLGQSLESLMSKHKKFGLRTVLITCIQMLRTIKYIHDCGYIHKDIKPDNFVLDYKNSKKIYCIDFGMAKRYIKSGVHIEHKSGYKFMGTCRYSSIASHQGVEQSRKDDLEAIGYLMVYFFKGKLPWQIIKDKEKTERYKKIGQMKEETTTDNLCKGMPKEFIVYMNYVKSLDFDETPEYNSLINMFIKLYESKNWEKETLEWEKN